MEETKTQFESVRLYVLADVEKINKLEDDSLDPNIKKEWFDIAVDGNTPLFLTRIEINKKIIEILSNSGYKLMAIKKIIFSLSEENIES